MTEGRGDARVIGERDRALVVELQRREGLHGVEEVLLRLPELPAPRRAETLGVHEEGAATRVTGPIDDARDPILERLVVDPPARRREHEQRSDERLVDDALGIAGAPHGVVARFALAEAIDGREEVRGRDVGRARFRLDELLAERLLLG